MKSRLVDLSQEKEKELNHLKATCPQDSPPIDICFDKSQLFEEKSKLELDLVSKVKENASLKKKNLKLGELLIQRDAVILKQRKQLAQLTDRVQEYESSQVRECMVYHVDPMRGTFSLYSDSQRRISSSFE